MPQSGGALISNSSLRISAVLCASAVNLFIKCDFTAEAQRRRGPQRFAEVKLEHHPQSLLFKTKTPSVQSKIYVTYRSLCARDSSKCGAGLP